MADVELNVYKRDGRGKGYSNKLYAKGYVPAVFYGKTVGSIPIELETKGLDAVLKTGRNSIIDLNIKDQEGETSYKAILKDIVYHPIKQYILHADFMQISMKDKIQITIPLNLAGEAPGVAVGGMLEHLLREVDIKCLPGNIPDAITADVSGLNIGDSVTIADIDVPEGIEILAEGDTVVARVAASGAEEPAEGEETPAEENTGAEEENA
ncbi:50S ribosomal protein L25 [Desulfolucanica intricata]|uniref:50S ribosomal protein L25 n=1 Tax=Desulfolucanica intricata TaxID=1285191 RepID=UPI00082D0522|nr:50S ribosomal protein L25 [Desulfolucanica intricata]